MWSIWTINPYKPHIWLQINELPKYSQIRRETKIFQLKIPSTWKVPRYLPINLSQKIIQNHNPSQRFPYEIGLEEGHQKPQLPPNLRYVLRELSHQCNQGRKQHIYYRQHSVDLHAGHCWG